MITVLVLILVITAFVYFVNRFLSFKVCPICAGVSGAWILAILGIMVGFFPAGEFLPLILMLVGGTVVGIAFQGERRFAFAQKSVWHWKVPVIMVGFPLFFWLSASLNWLAFTIEIILISVLAYLFFIRSEQNKFKNQEDKISATVKEELEKRLDECC